MIPFSGNLELISANDCDFNWSIQHLSLEPRVSHIEVTLMWYFMR